MKTFEELVDISLKENGYIGGENIPNSVGFIYKEAAKAYAQQVAEDVIERASSDTIDIMMVEDSEFSTTYVPLDSILNTEIILP